MLNESHIISYLKAHFPESIGDDAAVLPLSEKESYIITKDLLVEDIHFRISYNDAKSLAFKALHANLSDIAAMGATPKYVLLGLSIPVNYQSYIQLFLEGFAAACKSSGVTILGGDTTKSPNKLFLSVTAIGSSPKDNIKLRKTAKIGDIVCVAGNLGHAHIGFTALEKDIRGLTAFKEVFLKPNAKINEGQWFGSKAAITAMMDISDGLYIDLKRLCEASNVGAEIILDNLKPPQELMSACKELNLDPIPTQLTGGEDYGLLVTIAHDSYQSIASEFAATFGYQLKLVGHVAEGNSVYFTQGGQHKSLNLQPFSHFGEL